MTSRHPLRLAAVAAVAALAGFGVQATEATQWEPALAQPTATSATRATPGPNTDALREPNAWTVSRHEATEFQDAMSRGTMATRDQVRREMAAASAHGVNEYLGEAGRSEASWELRDRFAAAGAAGVGRTAIAAGDPIGDIAVFATPAVPSAEPGGSMYSLAPDGSMLSLPRDPAVAPDAMTAMTPSDARSAGLSRP